MKKSCFFKIIKSNPPASSIVLLIQFHNIVVLFGLLKHLQKILECQSLRYVLDCSNIRDLLGFDLLHTIVNSSICCEIDYQRFFFLTDTVDSATGLSLGSFVEVMIIVDKVSVVRSVQIICFQWEGLTSQPSSSGQFLQLRLWKA